MKQSIAYIYDKDTKEFKCSTIVFESPLEPGKYLIPPNSTLVKPKNNENFFDGKNWIFKKKYNGIFYNKQTKEPFNINSFDLSDDLTEIAPSQFDEWKNNKWVENKNRKEKKEKEDKIKEKYQKELEKLVWLEVKKNKDNDLDDNDLLEIDKKLG